MELANPELSKFFAGKKQLRIAIKLPGTSSRYEISLLADQHVEHCGHRKPLPAVCTSAGGENGGK